MLKYSHNVPTIRNSHISIERVARVLKFEVFKRTVKIARWYKYGTNTKAWPTLTILAVVCRFSLCARVRHKRYFVYARHIARTWTKWEFSNIRMHYDKRKEKNYALRLVIRHCLHNISNRALRLELDSCNNFRLDYLRGQNFASTKLRSRLMPYDFNGDLNILRFYSVIKIKTFINNWFLFDIRSNIFLSRERGMQWLCIPSNVSMERREHEAMNGWMILLLKLDRLFLQHRKNLLEEVFFSSFTVIHTEWASDSSYKEYGDNDKHFSHGYNSHFNQKDWSWYDAKYASHIFVSAHPTSRMMPKYSV